MESFVKRKRKECTKNSNRLLVKRKYLEKRFSVMYSRNRQKEEPMQDRNLKE